MIESGHDWEVQIRGMRSRMSSDDFMLTMLRLFHMVCRANQTRDQETAFGSECECCTYRLLPI